MNHMALFFLMLFVAGSYGWAVRGTTLGKETGAMLPGALLGILCAWFSGSALLWENLWIFCAAGALGMFVGGTETYGETIGFVVAAKPPDPRRGYGGLALKGLLWFGIAGAFLGISFTAVTGNTYTIRDFIWLFAPMPLIWAAGVAVLNSPFCPKEGKFPKIYFSQTRKEVWGGMVAMLLTLLIFMLVKKDHFALYLCIGGAVGGALGWVLGMWFFRLTVHPMRNGKQLFGRLQPMLEGWKLMENTLGAAGFLGIGAGFALGYPHLQAIIAAVERTGGLWNPLGEHAELLSWGMLLLITVGELLLAGVYQFWLKKTKVGEAYLSLVHKSLYTYLSLPLVYLGALRYARLVSVFLIYLALAIKMLGGGKAKRKASLAYKIPIVLSSIALLFAEILWGGRFTALSPWLLYTLVYFGFEFLRTMAFNAQQKKQHASKLTVEAFKALGIAALWMFAYNFF